MMVYFITNRYYFIVGPNYVCRLMNFVIREGEARGGFKLFIVQISMLNTQPTYSYNIILNFLTKQVCMFGCGGLK